MPNKCCAIQKNIRICRHITTDSALKGTPAGFALLHTSYFIPGYLQIKKISRVFFLCPAPPPPRSAVDTAVVEHGLIFINLADKKEDFLITHVKQIPKFLPGKHTGRKNSVPVRPLPCPFSKMEKGRGDCFGAKESLPSGFQVSA
jgi:hypothetical protein